MLQGIHVQLNLNTMYIKKCNTEMRNMLPTRFHTLPLVVEDWYIHQICAPFITWREKWSLSHEVWLSHFDFFHILIPISSFDKTVLGFTSQAAYPQLGSLPLSPTANLFQFLRSHWCSTIFICTRPCWPVLLSARLPIFYTLKMRPMFSLCSQVPVPQLTFSPAKA